MPEDEFEAILARPAEEGAKRVLADVGLEGDEVALDIRNLRSLLDFIRLIRCTAVQTVVRLVTSAVLLALLAGVAIKLRTSAEVRRPARSTYRPTRTRPRGGGTTVCLKGRRERSLDLPERRTRRALRGPEHFGGFP